MSNLSIIHSTNPTQMVSLRCLTYQLKSIAKQNEVISIVSAIREIIKTPLLWNPTHQHHLFGIDIKKGGEPKLLHLLTPQQLGDQTKSRVYDFSLKELYHKIIDSTNLVIIKWGVENQRIEVTNEKVDRL